MKNIFSARADITVMLICFIYIIAMPVTMMGLGSKETRSATFDLNLMLIGVMAILLSFVMYYAYEGLYSLVLYRLRHELAMFGIGLFVIVAYLSFLTRYLFVGTQFNRLITNVSQLNEGLVNVTIIVSVLVLLTVLSVVFGHTLGETIYRLAMMYVVAIGNTMVFLYFNPLDLSPDVLLLVLNIIMIYFTLRQVARCRGLVVLQQHSYYNK